jgi:predicted phage terminase large subunit-like protein
MTRWAQKDLTGRLVQDMVRNPESDQWEVVEFPALFPKADVPDDAPEDEKFLSLWPEQWSVKALLTTKASMPPFQWSAQYMQNPTASESSIIKKEWWRKWEKDAPPPCEYIIMSLDAAAEKKNRSDFTSLSTWGVFYLDGPDGYPQANIILLNAIKDRWEYPTLKRRAYEEYKEWTPDWFVVEKKSAGTQLYQELRYAGVPAQEYNPHRGTGDKTARLNSVADIFASGLVWYPDGRRWAEDLVEEVCGFPNMDNDDQVDSTVMALLRFRTGGFITLPTDRWDEDELEPRRAAYY